MTYRDLALEKRKGSRMRVRVEGTYEHLSKGSGRCECIINDVGALGINMTGQESFIIGETMKVTFPLKEDGKKVQEITAHIEVVYTMGKTIGAKFSMIQKADEEKIKKFLLNKLVHK